MLRTTEKEININKKEFMVNGSPLGIYGQSKMLCELFAEEFVLTIKREALIQPSAGKKYNIPYSKIERINLIHAGSWQGVLIELNDASIDRPLFGRPVGMAFGGLIGALLAGKGEFRFYFYKKNERELFIETITNFNKSVEVKE